MSESANILNVLSEMNPEAILFDGLEEALVGIGQQFTKCCAVYSYRKLVDILVAEGLSYEEAVEHLDFNVVNLYAGPHTPIILFNAEDL